MLAYLATIRIISDHVKKLAKGLDRIFREGRKRGEVLIDKADIERVKRANDLAALVRGRGVKLARRGKQLVGLSLRNSARRGQA